MCHLDFCLVVVAVVFMVCIILLDFFYLLMISAQTFLTTYLCFFYCVSMLES